MPLFTSDLEKLSEKLHERVNRLTMSRLIAALTNASLVEHSLS